MKRILVFFCDVDPARLHMTVRTAVASCIALLLGTLLGLDHPQWAAMTVWIVALPTRGQRLERSLARILGTMLGAIAGMGLIALSNGSPALLIGGLTIWIGICAGMGNLLVGPRAYVCLLAGYSAAMVALLGHGHAEPIWILAMDRVLTICLGGVVASAAALLFAPKASADDLAMRMRDMMYSLLDHVATPHGSNIAEQTRLLSCIAAMDESLDMLSAGSFQARRQIRDIRQLFADLIELIMCMRSRQATSPDPSGHAAAEEKRKPQGETVSERMSLLAKMLASRAPDIAQRLQNLEPTWQRANQATSTLQPEGEKRQTLPHHRDWIGARYAALRSASAVAATGLLWIVTGWQLGPFIVMGAAIMTSVFSTFPNPAIQMRWVVGGSLAGAAAAIFAHLVVMPIAFDALTAALLAMPLMLLGAPVMAHRRIMLAGMEYNLIYLLMMNPNTPVGAHPPDVLLQAFAVVLGPISAFLAFQAVPVSAGRRLDFAIRLIVHDLLSMAKNDDRKSRQDELWRMRIYHRIITLVRWAERSGTDNAFAGEGGMAAVGLGNTLLTIRQLLANNAVDTYTQRALRAALISVGYLPNQPGRLVQAFERAARRLKTERPQDSASLHEIAARVAANQSFFRRAG